MCPFCIGAAAWAVAGAVSAGGIGMLATAARRPHPEEAPADGGADDGPRELRNHGFGLQIPARG